MLGRKERIASFIVFWFFAGSVIAPVAHQIQHGVASERHAHDRPHEHPDYDALSDNGRHYHDSELFCVLCSVSFVAVEDHGTAFNPPEKGAPLLLRNATVHSCPGPVRSIRGPPRIA